MLFTETQEEQLIHQYDKLIWSVVHRFKRRMGGYHNNLEDLYQEAVLVFIQHIRSCKTEEEIKCVPIRDMVNAMCRFVLGEQVVSVPKRTTSFSQVIGSVSTKVDYTEIDLDETKRDLSMDNVVQQMDFTHFISSLPPSDRRVVLMKANGYRNREIAQRLGVTDVVVTRTLKKIKNQYLAYAA